jgi:hypothetical protein
MLGRNGNIAYVRYDSQGRIVAGGPIIQAKPPKNGTWKAVSNVIGNSNVGSNGTILRAFIRLDMFGRVVPSSLVIQTKEPGDANSGTAWLELNASLYCITTTSTSTSTTTTTTTAVPRCINYTLSYVCPIESEDITIRAGYIQGCSSDQFYWSQNAYLTEAEALDPGIPYLGPATNPVSLDWSTHYYPPDNHKFWVSIKDGNGNKTVKGVTSHCETTTTTSTSTSTSTTTSTTSSTTTINPSTLANTIFAKYDVVPGPAQGVETIFVKYGVR